MNITQLKQKVESNLAGDLFVLEGIAVTNESLSKFLTDLPGALQFRQANSIVSAGEIVQIVQDKGNAWQVSGLTAGIVQDAKFSLLLSSGESGVDAQIVASGSFNIATINRSLPISGSLSDPGGNVIDITVGVDDLPGFPELAEAVGLGGVTESFSDLEMDVPTVDAARFGYDINANAFTYLAVDGSIPFGDSALLVSCMFTPELTISGSLPDDGSIQLSDIFSTLGFDASNVPGGDLSALSFSLTPAAKNYSFAIELESDWNLKFGTATLSVTKVGVALEHAEDVTTVALTGQIEVGATSLAISANRNDSGNWEFSGGLAEGSSIKLRSVINVFLPNALNLPQEVPDMACRNITMTFLPATSQFSFTADSADSWAIPIGSGLSLKDISLRINREKKGTTSQVSGFIGGTLVIGAAYITTAYAFPGDFVLTGEIPSFKLSKLVQDICGVDAALSVTTSVPPGFLDAELTNISFRIAPQQREMSLSGSSKFGQAEIQIKRKADQTWGFAVGLVPPQNWKLSTINDSLAVLDGLQFSNTSLILASSDDSNITLSTVKPPRNDVAIIRGVNLFANLSMTGTGVDSLLGIKTLVVYAAIGSDPQNIKLEAQVDAEYKISDSVYFGNFVFRLQPAPSNFLIALEGNLRVLMSGTDLRFTGGLSVQAKPSFQASMYARMSGTWKDPFGVTGVAISDVGIEFKVPPLTPPSMAFAGALKIGNFTGAMAIKFDPTSPVVAIAFNRLYLSDIFDTFCPPAVKKVIPNGISTTVLNVGFENVKIYIVPKATTIAGVSFAQGTSLEGTMNLWGLRVSASVKIEQSKGVLIKGEVDPVNIGGVFKLTGAGSKPKASLTLDLRAGATPVIDVSGAVELLGYKSETSLQITDKEFNFNTTSKLFNLFQASLQVKGSSMTSSNGIYVKATMQNDLFKYLRDNAAREIEKVANSAKASLDGAISKVNDAKTSVGTLDKQITTAKATVKAERDRDDAKIKTAETDVSKAQTTVNNLQTDIDNAKKRIAQLNQDITNKNNWYNRLAWYDKTWAWTELSAYVAAKGAEITALYTKIAGYEAAKHTAFAVLEAAKVLLGELRKAIKITPIELDYRVASLITLRASAKAALDLAELTLKGLKSSIGAAADVATFITNAGLGGLIDIRKASFEGYLSAMNGGRVSLAVELTFMNSRTVSKYTFTFNFKDPLSSVKDLAKLILPA